MLFPSIHLKAAEDHCLIVGAMPSSLTNKGIVQDRFATIQQHIRTRLTNNFSSKSIDPRYVSYCFDVMSNLSATYNDTRMIMNRGLTAADDKHSGLGVRGKGDSSFLGSVDSKQKVKNLCTSQKYIKWSHFLTFTANQKIILVLNRFGIG